MISVLLADDDKWILSEMKSIIDWEHYGFEIVGSVADGASAYKFMLKNKPDILFTDIVMPNITGLELLDKLSKKNINIDVILLTGYAEFKYAQEACKLGAFDYLLKPIEKESLHDTLQRLKQKFNILNDKEDETFISLIEPKHTNNETLKLILNYINKNLDTNLHLYEIAEKFHFNFSYISQLFKKELGILFSEYVTQMRMDMAERLLNDTNLPIKEICRNVGINDYFYFNKLFKKYKKITPAQLRSQSKK